VRLSALRPPLSLGFLGDGRDHEDKTRAHQRAAGTKNTALFDIVNAATANGSLRAPHGGALVSQPSERQRAKTRDTRASECNRPTPTP